MPTVLVTGAAGFLGSHLCDALIAAGNDVVGVDNLYTGSMRNIEHLKENNAFRFVEHDITKPLDMDGIDEIYNLACPASPPKYQHDPLFTIETCYSGVKNMLELAVRNKARFLQASTSEVYGDPNVHPQPETYWGYVNSFGIRSCYDEGKRIGETLVFEYGRAHEIVTKVVRIFNTYGPRMDIEDGRVVSNFIVQALEGKPLTIYGDGSQTRSFCYVSDLIDVMMRMMASEDSFIGPVNIGSPYEMSVKGFAEEVIRLTGKDSEIVYKELPSDDPKRRRPDISKAKDKLDWQPSTEVRAGLEKTIAYFKNVL